MFDLRHSTLARQISFSSGIVLCLFLLLTLPLMGWWAGSFAVPVQTASSAPDTGAIDMLIKREETRDIQAARDAGDSLYRELSASLLLHEENAELGEQELPLITLRNRPLHFASDSLKALLASARLNDSDLMLFAKTEDGFELAGHSAWPATGGTDFGEGMSPTLSSKLDIPVGQAEARYLSLADQNALVYLRPLRNSAGEVKAAMVIIGPQSAMLPALTALRTRLIEAGQAPVNTQHPLHGKQRQMLAGLGLLCALLISGLFYLFMRRDANLKLAGIKDLTTTALKFSTGDWSARAKDPTPGAAGASTRNEISLLARSMNRMAEQTGQLLDALKRDAGKVARAALEVSHSARHIDEGSQRETQAANGMAAAVEEMTTSISSVGQNAEEARGISQRAHELVAEGSAAVASATEQMQTISQTVQSTAGVIAQLGEQSRQISAIAAMIREIAEQTNLLALNAAIEAARAGENGRGFSVVADEVRRLAERTSDSTEQIQGMIDAIQSSADIAVHNMETAVTSVSEGVNLVSHVGETISRIHDDASQVAHAVDAINVALREQNAASNSIAQQVDCVAQMSGSTHHSAATAVAVADEMQRTARRMVEALKKIG